jgi:hypothetical protein
MPGFFDTPDPPDPISTAAAQTGTNVNTALANTALNQVNQVTPQGNLSYSQTGSTSFTDPVTGVAYQIPQSTATQTLSPMGQATFDQQQGAQYNLASLGNDQARALRDQFANAFNLNGAPAFGNSGIIGNAPGAIGNIPDRGSAVSGFGDAGQPTAAFGDAGQIGSTFGAAPGVQTGYQHGDDFSADRQRIEAGLMERLNPSLAIERNKYEQQLADQGIRYGSPAYEDAMRNYSMQANDARLGVIGKGGEEQQRLSEMSRLAGVFGNTAQQQIYQQALGRGEFANRAQQQQFEQLKGRGEFANNAQEQLYEQLFGRAQFGNAAQQQNFSQDAQRATLGNAALAQNFQQAGTAFNAANATRQQYLDEQFALRNQPINEISALLSGSQVSRPNFLNTGGATIPTTDVAGLINRNFDQQMAASNQQSATANNIIGGLFGFAGGLGRGGFFNSSR